MGNATFAHVCTHAKCPEKGMVFCRSTREGVCPRCGRGTEVKWSVSSPLDPKWEEVGPVMNVWAEEYPIED